MDDDSEFAPFCAFCRLGSDLLNLLEDDDPRMAKLENLKLYADVLGNHWCEEHWHRGRVINWGKKHGWPLLNLRNGTIGGNVESHVDFTQPLLVLWMVARIIPSGIDSWYHWFVTSENEEVGYLAEGIIDQLENKEKAS